MTLAIRRGPFDPMEFSSMTRAAVISSRSMIDCLFDASPVGQCLLDRTMCFAAVNNSLCTLLETPVEQLLGRPATSVVKDAERVIELAFGLAESGRAIPKRRVLWGGSRYELSFSAVCGAAREVVGLAVAIVDITRHWQIERRLKKSRRKLLDKSEHDHLTGLLNRRGLEAKLHRELRRARREGSSLALLLVDIDVFKAFNDRFGHVAGDRCLKAVAAELRTCLRRPGDAACRYGGEEFALILPNLSAQDAALVAETCRAAVETLEIALPTRSNGVTISIGIAAISPPRDGASTAIQSSALLDAADRALYRAKAAGRNRCEIA